MTGNCNPFPGGHSASWTAARQDESITEYGRDGGTGAFVARQQDAWDPYEVWATRVRDPRRRGVGL